MIFFFPPISMEILILPLSEEGLMQSSCIYNQFRDKFLCPLRHRSQITSENLNGGSSFWAPSMFLLFPNPLIDVSRCSRLTCALPFLALTVTPKASQLLLINKCSLFIAPQSFLDSFLTSLPFLICKGPVSDLGLLKQ